MIGLNQSGNSQKIFRVAFFGTPEFSVPTLEALSHHPLIQVVKVITMPSRQSGRGMELSLPPVAEYAIKHKISLAQTENINKDEALLADLESLSIDFFLVIAFAQFLGSRLLSMPKIAAFNIHTSLLPKYRGAAPIQYALLNGDVETGVSIQRMVKQMDAGDLCLLKPTPIYPYENGGMLFNRLKNLSALAIVELIDQMANDTLKFTPQLTNENSSLENHGISFAPEIKKEDGQLHFKTQTAEAIINRMRAFHPWPSVYCFLNGLRLKVHAMELSKLRLKAGEVQFDQWGLNVGTLTESLRLTFIQLEGKKMSSDLEAYNGLKNKFQNFEIS